MHANPQSYTAGRSLVSACVFECVQYRGQECRVRQRGVAGDESAEKVLGQIMEVFFDTEFKSYLQALESGWASK